MFPTNLVHILICIYTILYEIWDHDKFLYNQQCLIVGMAFIDILSILYIYVDKASKLHWIIFM